MSSSPGHLHRVAPFGTPGQPHGPFKDGGVVCRTGLTMWRDMRRQQMAAGGLNLSSPPPVLVHLVERSSRFSGNDDVNASGDVLAASTLAYSKFGVKALFLTVEVLFLV